ncbi:MAG: hypothetical protein OD918_11620, partial [Gammaproteobacteria bacterium]
TTEESPIKHKTKSLLKLAAAAMLFFAATPLHAANALDHPGHSVQRMGFTEANEKPPFIARKDLLPDAASGGAIEFSLDLYFGTNTQPVHSIMPLIHYNSKKIKVISVSNILRSGHISPLKLGNPRYTPESPLSALTVDGKPVDSDADGVMLLSWHGNNKIDAVAKATTHAPVRIATIKFKWKAGATGNTYIGITQGDSGTAHHFDTESIIVQGARDAKVTVRDENIDVTADEVELQVKCALSRTILAETICTLDHAIDSSAVPGKDYTVHPAIQGATIVIPSGVTSGLRIFRITPAHSGDGKMISIALLSADSDGGPIALDVARARIPLASSQVLVSKSKIKTDEAGGGKRLLVQLATQPRGGDVIIDVSSTDTTEAAVSPESLRFTAANWNTPQQVIVRGVDDSYDDGDKKYEIRLVVDDSITGARLYHGKVASVSGKTIDDDKAAVELTASPAHLSELGGEQHIVITANLRNKATSKYGAVRFESETRVTLRKAGGTATESTDYKPFILPGRITIPAGQASAAATFSINVLRDNIADEKETIKIAGAFVLTESIPNDIIPNDISLSIGAFNPDVDRSGGANARDAVSGRDGIMILRYLLGVRGKSLTEGQSNEDPDVVAANIADCIAFLHLDEDKKVTRYDGILLVRYLLGLRGDALVKGFPDIDSDAVMRNIKKFLP